MRMPRRHSLLQFLTSAIAERAENVEISVPCTYNRGRKPGSSPPYADVHLLQVQESMPGYTCIRSLSSVGSSMPAVPDDFCHTGRTKVFCPELSDQVAVRAEASHCPAVLRSPRETAILLLLDHRPSTLIRTAHRSQDQARWSAALQAAQDPGSESPAAADEQQLATLQHGLVEQALALQQALEQEASQRLLRLRCPSRTLSVLADCCVSFKMGLPSFHLN